VSTRRLGVVTGFLVSQAAPANAEYRRMRDQLARGLVVTEPARAAAATSSAPAGPPALPEQVAGALLSGQSGSAIQRVAIERARPRPPATRATVTTLADRRCRPTSDTLPAWPTSPGLM
jgi:hypothetical protein